MNDRPNYKWYVLFLVALTGAFALGAPAVSLAVLFPEISRDLNLNLVQMGLLWSIGSLLAILTSPLVGAIDDRFGPKRVILAGTVLVGLAAGMRGMAADFTSLFLIIMLVGGLVPLLTTTSYKICGIWFPPRQLGLANGVLAMGIALGSLLGSLLSATVLSPWLGGWRNVLLFYGVLSVLLCIPWYFSRSAPEIAGRAAPETATIPMRMALTHIVKLKNVWLLGITLMGIGGCVQGLAGYLPVYLRGQGWDGAAADGALSLLSAMSMVFILPVALWSDRLGARKTILLGMILMIAVGTGLLTAANGWIVWAAVILAGMARDGSTALLMTMVIETDGVGPVYAGSAAGFVMFFFFVGNLFSAPLGNKLADIFPGLPFAFWAGLAVLGMLSLTFAKPSQPVNTRREFGGKPEIL